MTTIFEALRTDHDRQRQLLAQLVETHGDSAARERVFAQIKAALVHHAAAEERYFYVPLMQCDMTQEKARHSVAEHHEIDELIEALEATSHSSPSWLATAKKLQEMVTHHLDEEEQEVFQLAGRALENKQKTDLAGDYRRFMDEMAV